MFTIPPSKSVTHRAYLLAALCTEPTFIRHPLRALDCDATLRALEALGAQISIAPDGISICGPIRAPKNGTALDLSNAGTGLRFLTAQAARFEHLIVLDGDSSLRSRNSDALLDVLRGLGAVIDSSSGRAPLRVLGPIIPADISFAAGISSQYASAMLFALNMGDRPVEMRLNRPVHSRPYFELSVSMAAHFGAELTVTPQPETWLINVAGNGFHSPQNYEVEGDWSSAAFLIVAAFLTEKKCVFKGLRRDSLQADRAVLDIISKYGGAVRWDALGNLSIVPGEKSPPHHIDVRLCPDLFPILCVLAALRGQDTRIDGAPNLRHKESDRIKLMRDGLAVLGIVTHSLPDGLQIEGGIPRAGIVRTEGDHRIQMSFRVLSVVMGIEIITDGSGSERVSYPNFERHLTRLKHLSPVTR